ncbi:putative metalloprotease [Fibrisoma limi BUZ 3]|uniref:Putative metalloprotease n=2 Tax=Fibrisoma limi TaxID=663275 RepID=I2GK75_9BACT|nr:putative metalloprotease [Fibrisoma limi BUZ 3]
MSRICCVLAGSKLGVTHAPAQDNPCEMIKNLNELTYEYDEAVRLPDDTARFRLGYWLEPINRLNVCLVSESKTYIRVGTNVHVQQKTRPMKRIAIILFLLTSVPTLSLAQIDPSLIQAGLDALNSATLTNAQVAAYSRQAVQQMDAQNPVAGPNDPYTLRLNRIVQRHRTVAGLPINYKVYKVPQVNAFATADGSVRVFKGLMDIMTDSEILAIIGHEIGHVVNKDSHDAMKSALRRSAVRNLAASNSGVIGRLSRSQIGGVADYLLGASFSRRQETEADDYSYTFLRKNGYNVLALATSFEKLAKQGGGSGRLTQFVSTHPDSKARADRIRARARKDGLIR